MTYMHWIFALAEHTDNPANRETTILINHLIWSRAWVAYVLISIRIYTMDKKLANTLNGLVNIVEDIRLHRDTMYTILPDRLVADLDVLQDLTSEVADYIDMNVQAIRGHLKSALPTMFHVDIEDYITHMLADNVTHQHAHIGRLTKEYLEFRHEQIQLRMEAR